VYGHGLVETRVEFLPVGKSCQIVILFLAARKARRGAAQFRASCGVEPFRSFNSVGVRMVELLTRNQKAPREDRSR